MRKNDVNYDPQQIYQKKIFLKLMSEFKNNFRILYSLSNKSVIAKMKPLMDNKIITLFQVGVHCLH